MAIISTPYHGYLKNVAVAVAGKWDTHHSPLWEGGHVKFWSRATLRTLFQEAGLREAAFYRVGRLAPFAKSMVCVFAKPLETGPRPAER
jgi:2-polyprenyl-6-hydroxyphenyl methylase/3-demethylubiquinone-9 3-methyltransferase